MRKSLAFLLLLSLLLTVFTSPSFAKGRADDRGNDKGSFWYVERRGNQQPGIPAAACELLKKYDAYYIDDTVSDSGERRVLYLTFDAGYENGNVARILDALRDEGVPAAFFVLDHLITAETALVERMRAEGHLVCNHTKTHRNMCLLTEEEMATDLTALQTRYRETCHAELSPYFRFPEGRYNEATLACAQRLGYKTVFWSFGYADWDNTHQPEPRAAIKKILDNTHNGAVMLFHPTSATNAEIFPTLLREWKRQGYEFGTLDQLTGAGAAAESPGAFGTICEPR